MAKGSKAKNDEVSWGRPILWKPSKEDIAHARELGKVPDDVVISPLPNGSDIYSGRGLPENSIVLSPSHLQRIRFPLHPLFHLALNSLGLASMQLNPNAYHMLSAFLGFGFKRGVSVDFKDFFHFHSCAKVRHEHIYFHFATPPGCVFFRNKPAFCKDWKKRPLLITGNWAAPEVSHIRIPSAFSVRPALDTTRQLIELAEERINWLKENLAGLRLNIADFSDDETLLQISCDRQSPIYGSYTPEIVNLNKYCLRDKSLVHHIIASHTQLQFSTDSEECSSSSERSPSEEEAMVVEGEPTLRHAPKQRRLDTHASVPQKRQKVDGPTDLGSVGSSQICKVKEIFDAMGRCLDEAVCEEQVKSTSLKECEKDLDRWRDKTTELEAKLMEAEETARKLKEELTAEQKARQSEYENSCHVINMERVRHFRYGWDQALLPPDERVVPDPDAMDEHYDFQPGGYEFIKASDQTFGSANDNEFDLSHDVGPTPNDADPRSISASNRSAEAIRYEPMNR